jgi:hypothetical protein
VEAMLKSAMQSQLDGVRVGLNQLQIALHEIGEIKQKYEAQPVIISQYYTARHLLQNGTSLTFLHAAHSSIHL